MDEIILNSDRDIEEMSLADSMKMFARRKITLFFIFISLFAITSLIAIFLPSVYKSSATILIEQQEIPQDLVRSTVTSYADQRVQIISQRVMTSVNLKEIIDKYGLYIDERETYPLEVIIEDMRDEITMEMISADVVDPRTGKPAKATIAFSLAFENETPRLAQQVANELVTLFLNENLKNRTEMAQEANTFLSEEAESLGSKVSELESELAEFKSKYSDSLPERVDLNFQMMERKERELSEVKRQLMTLNERKIYLESELTQVPRNMGSFSETGERILSSRDRLKVLETEYLGLLAKYSAQHPDVVKVKKEMDALSEDVGGTTGKKELAVRLEEAKTNYAELLQKYSDSHPDVKKAKNILDNLESEYKKSSSVFDEPIPGEKPDNPAYIQLQAQLQAANSEIISLRQDENDIKEKIQDYEDRLTKSPEVEREYRALLRDYENSVAKFQEVKAKQMEAQLAQNLESENKAERFTMIEPPLLPEEPYSPNRIAIFLIGLIASLFISFVTVYLIGSMDKSVYDRAGVARILGQPPLTVIPYIETTADKRSRYLKAISIAIVLIILILIALLLIHNFYKPLDVLWFIINRKLGIG